MKSLKNIIFDFDGTLVDTAPLIVRTMQETIRQMNLPPKTREECRATIGLRLEEIPDVLWGKGQVDPEKYAATYRLIFDRLKRPLAVECFPSVLETLKTLHESGIRMAIASSRSHKSLEEYVEIFGIADYFDMLVGGNDVENGKPSPEPVEKILKDCHWEASETLTVGDAPVDILMGRGAGTYTCAVTYGNGKRDELTSVNPDFIIDRFDRLPEVVARCR